MNCESVQKELLALVGRQESSSPELRLHVHACAACRREERLLRRAFDGLAIPGGEPLEDDYVAAVLARVAEEGQTAAPHRNAPWAALRRGAWILAASHLVAVALGAWVQPMIQLPGFLTKEARLMVVQGVEPQEDAVGPAFEEPADVAASEHQAASSEQTLVPAEVATTPELLGPLEREIIYVPWPVPFAPQRTARPSTGMRSVSVEVEPLAAHNPAPAIFAPERALESQAEPDPVPPAVSSAVARASQRVHPVSIQREGDRVRIQTSGPPDAVVPALLASLQDGDQNVQGAVVQRLAMIGQDLGLELPRGAGAAAVDSPWWRSENARSGARAEADFALPRDPRQWDAWWNANRGKLPSPREASPGGNF